MQVSHDATLSTHVIYYFLAYLYRFVFVYSSTCVRKQTLAISPQQERGRNGMAVKSFLMTKRYRVALVPIMSQFAPLLLLAILGMLPLEVEDSLS